MRPVSGSKKVRNMRPVSRSNDAAVTPHFLLFQAQAYQSPEDLSVLSRSDNIFRFSIIVCCVRSPHFWSPCPSPASQTRAVQRVSSRSLSVLNIWPPECCPNWNPGFLASQRQSSHWRPGSVFSSWRVSSSLWFAACWTPDRSSHRDLQEGDIIILG